MNKESKNVKMVKLTLKKLKKKDRIILCYEENFCEVVIINPGFKAKISVILLVDNSGFKTAIKLLRRSKKIKEETQGLWLFE